MMHISYKFYFKKLFLCYCISCMAHSTAISQKLFLHSHNDYDQEIPLHHALDLSYNSIEIDIVAYNNELIVSHDTKHLSKKPRLDEAYLKKIKRFLSIDSLTYDLPLILLMDIKEYNDLTLILLHQLLEKYDPLLMNVKSTTIKPLQVILSGDIPRSLIINDKRFKYFFIDGRPSDLHKNYNSFIMPWISQDFSKLTKWNGINKLSLKDELNIKNKIYAIQQQGKKVRFWKTNDLPEVWKFLYFMKVDVISTDSLKKLHTYLETIK